MPRLKHQTPRYCLHKRSGTAVVYIGGRGIPLGTHGTKESREKYDRLVAEWLEQGRSAPPAVKPDSISIARLVADFWTHAKSYYKSGDGQEAGNYRDALRPLVKLYSRTPANDFGPLKLKAIRGEMIRMGWCRTHINRQLLRVRHVFRWGVENEMVNPLVYQGLKAVAGLRAGKSDAAESVPVRPVNESHVDAILPHVASQVKAMILLQQITGARPGEICIMRGIDLKTSGDVWTYKPESHKTAHHGHQRMIYLGPKAKEVLSPHLKPDLQAFIFSPHEAAQELRQRRHEQRVTPGSCGNSIGSNRVRKPRVKPGSCYSVDSYRRAIARACEVAGVPRWHPHQLRHTAATRWRSEFGPDAAQILLGDRTTRMVDVYAEKDQAKAIQIMQKIG